MISDVCPECRTGARSGTLAGAELGDLQRSQLRDGHSYAARSWVVGPRCRGMEEETPICIPVLALLITCFVTLSQTLVFTEGLRVFSPRNEGST